MKVIYTKTEEEKIEVTLLEAIIIAKSIRLTILNSNTGDTIVIHTIKLMIWMMDYHFERPMLYPVGTAYLMKKYLKS